MQSNFKPQVWENTAREEGVHPDQRALFSDMEGRYSNLWKLHKEFPIEELELSVRGYNTLKRLGINTIGELIASLNHLTPTTPVPSSGLRQQEVGEKTLHDIKETLQYAEDYLHRLKHYSKVNVWQKDAAPPRKLSDEDEQALLEMYADPNNRVADIAAAAGVTVPTLIRILWKHNVQMRGKGNPRLLSPEIEQEIIEKYKNGVSMRELTQEYNINSNLVYLTLHRNNISPDRGVQRRNFIKVEDGPQIIDLAQQGYPLDQIANQFKINPSVIVKFLQREGVDIPNPINDASNMNKHDQEGWNMLGRYKHADYFYDSMGVFPDDGSLQYNNPTAPAPAYFNMPSKSFVSVHCPECDTEIEVQMDSPPGHMINFDEANKRKEYTCESCGYNWPMEYDILIPFEQGNQTTMRRTVGKPVIKEAYDPYGPQQQPGQPPVPRKRRQKQWEETPETIQGPDGQAYVVLSRGMSDKEFKKWHKGELISKGKYFTSLPRTFYVHPDLVRQTDQHTFTLVGNGILQGEYIYPIAPDQFSDFNPVHFGKFTTKEAKKVGDTVGVDWRAINLTQFHRAMEFEAQESRWPKGANPSASTVAKIVLSNLKEFPDYYEKMTQWNTTIKQASDEPIDRFNQIPLLPIDNSKPLRNIDLPESMPPALVEVDNKREKYKNRIKRVVEPNDETI